METCGRIARRLTRLVHSLVGYSPGTSEPEPPELVSDAQDVIHLTEARYSKIFVSRVTYAISIAVLIKSLDVGERSPSGSELHF
jgi:hypothetical protein